MGITIRYEDTIGWMMRGEDGTIPFPGNVLEDLHNEGSVSRKMVKESEPRVYLIVTRKGSTHLAAPVMKKVEKCGYRPYWGIFSWDEKNSSHLKKLVPAKKIVAYTAIDLTVGTFRDIQKRIKKEGS